MSIPTLSPLLQQVLLDSCGFGLDGSGSSVEDAADLIENLLKISRNFSVQTDEPGLQHLNKLLTAQGGDYDKSILEAFLTRAPLRLVQVADVARVVSGEAQFSDPPPFAALTTDDREIDFPSIYNGTFITALGSFDRSSWWEDAVDARHQPASRYLRDDVWDKIFKNFLFCPRIYFCDPYICAEIERLDEPSSKPVNESGFGFFVSRLSELCETAIPAEEKIKPRSLHILSSTPNAKNNRHNHIKRLKTFLDELSPPFNVEFVVTELNYPGSNKKVLHDRFCATGTGTGNIIRVLSVTNSMNAYLGKKISSELTSFTLETNSVKAGVYGSYWAKTTSDWRHRGFEYRWSPAKA